MKEIEEILAVVRNAENRAAQEIRMGNEGWMENRRRYADTIVANAIAALTARENRIRLEAKVSENKYWKARYNEHSDEDTAFFDERIAQLTKTQDQGGHDGR